jgi:hypothetical protein
MNIDGAIRNLIQQFLRQQLTVSHYHQAFRSQGGNPFDRFGSAQPLWLEHGNIEFLGQHFNRWRDNLSTTTPSTIGLRDHKAKFSASFNQLLQGQYSEVRRPKKHQAWEVLNHAYACA